jgi:hypothetical protein
MKIYTKKNYYLYKNKNIDFLYFFNLSIQGLINLVTST